MDTKFRLDHVVILVNDLSIATKNFSTLGFTIVQGGEHEGLQTRNALIAFDDDSYLELIAFKSQSVSQVRESPKNSDIQELVYSARSRAERRALHWKEVGEGLVDFALLPENIDINIDTARQRGLTIEGPLPGSRLRPDDQQVSWQFGIPNTCDLPFLCADVTPRSMRVPVGAARRHPNGTTGIIGITIVVKDLNASVLRYRALLGIEPQRGATSLLPETKTADFKLISTTITLGSPIGKNSPLYNHLTTRGEGPYALRLRTNNNTRSGMLDLSLTRNSGIELMCN